MMAHFVFCHGFGFNVHFWDRIAPYFSQEKCSFIDLGYFNNQAINHEHAPEQKIIGIGHSIGLSKLVSMYHNFDYLIGLNSFINFLGSEQTMNHTRTKELKALRLSFLKDPELTLKNFYLRCGTPELIECSDFSNLNLHLILSDLEWLQKKYELPQTDTLIITSHDDTIVPNALTLDNFSAHPRTKIHCIMNIGHNLGLSKPLEVYEQIMSFLNDKTV